MKALVFLGAPLASANGRFPRRACLLLGLLMPASSWAGGVVTNCDEVSLRAAMSGGGLVTFACDGTIPLTNTLFITNDTTLDASGRSVTLYGRGWVRVCQVNSGVVFKAVNLTFHRGRSTNGGGIFNDGGTVCLLGSVLSQNSVSASPSANSSAEGGGIYNRGGTVNATNSIFVRNVADGRAGSESTPGVPARGAALFNAGGQVQLDRCVFSSNQVFGVSYSSLAYDLPGQDGEGGAIYSTGRLLLRQVRFNQNQAMGGDGADGPNAQNTPVSGSPAGAGRGGAVYSSGVLRASECFFVSNSAAGGVGGVGGGVPYDFPPIVPAGPGSLGGEGSGGAVWNSGQAEFLACSLERSSCVGGSGGWGGNAGIGPGGAGGSGGAAAGGAIHLEAGTLAMTNCTIARSWAAGGRGANGGDGGREAQSGGNGGSGGPGYGSALSIKSGLAVIVHATVASNSASGGAKGSGGFGGPSSSYPYPRGPRGADGLPGTISGAIDVSLATATLFNSIVAFNSPSNISGNLFEGGPNLSSDTNCTLQYMGSLCGIDPRLGPITTNGGPVPTMALLAASPAIDAAAGASCVSTDQRGVARPIGWGCDLGAFEADFTGSTIQFLTDRYEIVEQSTNLQVLVYRAGDPSGRASVDFTTRDGTAKAGSEYAATNGTLAFDPGERTNRFVLTLLSDFNFKGTQAFSLELSNPVGATLGTPSIAAVSITDVTVEDRLRASVAAGGRLRFTNHTIVRLTSSCVVSNDVELDGSGYNVTLSGSNAVRPFFVQSNASLTLRHLTLADGKVEGADGKRLDSGATLPGESVSGGCIVNIGGAVSAQSCVFLRNRASGGGGISGDRFNRDGGSGGSGNGGAIYNWGGRLGLTNCLFAGNSAAGGGGGPGYDYMGPSGNGGNGAPGWGGAISSSGGSLSLVDCSFQTNNAWGGSAGGFWAYPFDPHPGNSPGSGAEGSGGAISASPVFVMGSHFNGNKAWGQQAAGGAISGNAVITNSTFVDNQALFWSLETNDSTRAYGGAIFGRGDLTLVNCTLANNRASRDWGSEHGESFGGAVSCIGTALLAHVTLAGNSPGGIYGTSAVVRLRNSILAFNQASLNYVGGTLVDEGNNLSSDASCPFTAPGSRSNVDPLLAPLGDYWGPTPTMALLPGSPAIDAGEAAWCPVFDQRGFPRALGGRCDIGAFEVPAVFMFTSVAPTGTANLRLRGLGIPNRDFRLQTSVDLTTWQQITAGQATATGLFDIGVSNNRVEPKRFYRTTTP